MNAGQYLLALSPLPSGTAAQHLLAIQLGAGTGQTIFCSQRTVVFEQDETTVTRKPKRRAAPVEKPIVQPIASSGKQRDIVARFSQQSITAVFDGPEELTVTQRTARTTVTNRADEQIVRRPTKSIVATTGEINVYCTSE